MTEDRHVHEGSARRAPAHIHSHRALIGFDANGVPTVTHRADHCAEEDDPDAFIRDYNAAVAAYRKTFPTRDEVAEKTPDPAVREMLARAKSLGLETAFDRFDRQKPQCSFGLAGVCCKICNMGPCRVTTKSPRGVCGADADLIVSRNLLRSAAAGVAQHGMRAREVMLALKWLRKVSWTFRFSASRRLSRRRARSESRRVVASLRRSRRSLRTRSWRTCRARSRQ